MADLVAVRVRDCECPGAPHEGGDLVFLAPKLTLAGGLQASADIIAAAGDGSVLAAAWQVTFVKYGAVAWNFEDDEGPLAFDINVLLGDYEFALPVAEKADELYGDAVMRPLLARLKKLSPSGRTNGSTSVTPPATSKRRARSSPATTAVTPLSMP